MLISEHTTPIDVLDFVVFPGDPDWDAVRQTFNLQREDGVPVLHAAVDELPRSTSRLELARALLALGGALRRARRPSEAREPLRRALELADRCGADGLTAEVRAEIYATGARPRTAALQGAESLTASERRVADLAADGRSNKEIAQALYVMPKTVEVHLSNTYRKLSIRSRQQLAVALSAGGGNTGRSGRRSDGAPLRRPSILSRSGPGRPQECAHDVDLAGEQDVTSRVPALPGAGNGERDVPQRPRRDRRIDRFQGSP